MNKRTNLRFLYPIIFTTTCFLGGTHFSPTHDRCLIAQDSRVEVDRPVVVLSDAAQTFHDSVMLVDGHNDLPWEFRERGTPSFDTLDIGKAAPELNTDIERLKRGGVKAQFWSVYVPVSTRLNGEALLQTLEQIEFVHAMVKRYPETFSFCRSTADIDLAIKEGKIASMIGVEGGHSIENSLSVLEKLYDLGARYMTLTHSATLDWADASTDEGKHGGLTEFGEQVVLRMNELGMLVDLSHVSDEKAPVIFSHSSARAICDHPRNVPDDILPIVKANKGVIMVNFYSGFVVPEAGERNRLLQAETTAWKQAGDNESVIKSKTTAWRKTHPLARGSIHDVVDHIDHLVKMIGVDHVGIGSDFDGVDSLPEQLEDVSKYPLITQELLNRGYTEASIRKIMGENVMRVFREAEAISIQFNNRPKKS
ncbi:MAG: dipeptidase [Planctomycetota bacterium]|nr:dipeptidase [Planctomycetota bacterium]